MMKLIYFLNQVCGFFNQIANQVRQEAVVGIFNQIEVKFSMNAQWVDVMINCFSMTPKLLEFQLLFGYGYASHSPLF